MWWRSGLGDGKEIWRTTIAEAVTSPVAIGEMMLVLGDEAGGVHALSLAGKPLWTAKTGGKIVGMPLIVGQRVLVGSYDNQVYCLNAADGAQLWRVETGAQVHAGVVAIGGLVLTGGCDGFLRALDIEGGKEKWKLEVQGAIAAAPLVEGESVIVATMEGEVVCVDLGGRVVWKTVPLKDISPFTAVPARVMGRILLIADDGQVASLKVDEGGTAVLGKIVGRPGVNVLSMGEYVVVGTDEGRLSIIDPATARVVAASTLGGSVRGLARYGEGVIASTEEGLVWRLSFSQRP